MRVAWTEPLLLTSAEISRVPRGVPGVYVLMAATPESPVLVPFYVGQSSDLRRRLGEHLRSRHPVIATLTRYLCAYVALARILHAGMRGVAERALIAMILPAGNERVPSEMPDAINGPPLGLIDD